MNLGLGVSFLDGKSNSIDLMKRVLFLMFVLVGVLGTNALAGDKAKLREVYTSQIGVREATGQNDGLQVEKYLQSVNLGKGYAWCAAFITWSFRQAAYDVPSLPMAAQWLTTRKRILPDSVGTTDLFGVYFGNRVGHVGFVDSRTPTKIFTVEGNTNDNGSREGIGVFRRVRLIRTNLVFSRWT
jgi:hypothetical protein